MQVGFHFNMTSVLIRGKRQKEDSHVATAVGIGMTRLQVKELQEFVGNTGAGRGQGEFSSAGLRRSTAQMASSFWTSSLQNCEASSCFLSHPVCGLLQQPQGH